jgi:hypothetical protein
MYDLVNNFADDIKKIAKEMRREGNKPGMPVYVLTIADKLERIADGYVETAWEINMGEDL